MWIGFKRLLEDADSNTLKFCISSFATMVGGIVFLLADVVVIVFLSKYGKIMAIDALEVPLFIIPLAICVSFVPCLGFWGAIKSNRLILIPVAVVMLLFFIACLYIGFTTIKCDLRGNQTNSDLADMVVRVSRDAGYYWADEVEATLVNNVQFNFKCCGSFNMSEWNRTLLPATCCRNAFLNCTAVTAFQDDCATKFYDYTRQIVRTLGVFSILVSLAVLTNAASCWMQAWRTEVEK